ncbi:MAG: hypothetical protein GX250_07275 [Clostridiales bacterium]|jgi:hypothetical protein|nr:hypothetical protein [Clostridiales bacterium]
MKRLYACILTALILATTLCGCAVTATRTSPYATVRPEAGTVNPGAPGYGMDGDVGPNFGVATPNANRDAAPVR